MIVYTRTQHTLAPQNEEEKGGGGGREVGRERIFQEQIAKGKLKQLLWPWQRRLLG